MGFGRRACGSPGCLILRALVRPPATRFTRDFTRSAAELTRITPGFSKAPRASFNICKAQAIGWLCKGKSTSGRSPPFRMSISRTPMTSRVPAPIFLVIPRSRGSWFLPRMIRTLPGIVVRKISTIPRRSPSQLIFTTIPSPADCLPNIMGKSVSWTGKWENCSVSFVKPNRRKIPSWSLPVSREAVFLRGESGVFTTTGFARRQWSAGQEKWRRVRRVPRFCNTPIGLRLFWRRRGSIPRKWIRAVPMPGGREALMEKAFWRCFLEKEPNFTRRFSPNTPLSG